MEQKSNLQTLRWEPDGELYFVEEIGMLIGGGYVNPPHKGIQRVSRSGAQSQAFNPNLFRIYQFCLGRPTVDIGNANTTWAISPQGDVFAYLGSYLYRCYTGQPFAYSTVRINEVYDHTTNTVNRVSWAWSPDGQFLGVRSLAGNSINVQRLVPVSGNVTGYAHEGVINIGLGSGITMAGRFQWLVVPVYAAMIPTPTPTATLTPTPTPTMPPSCPAQTISTIDNVPVLVRSSPYGAVVGSIPSNTHINIMGGWEHEGTDGGTGIQWWWFVEYNGVTGYVREDLIQSNSCPKVLVPPPPLPVPVFNSECHVKLTGTTAKVFNHAEQVVEEDEITDQNLLIRVYGRDFDQPSTRFLISSPSQPQRWVTASLFQVADPQYVYGCRPEVLGRFRYSEDGSDYWRIVGYYANTFNAPVFFTTHDYGKFRNSQPYTGLHKGVDLVYGPPDGRGSPHEFSVYAQQNGVIVDVGPSGITGRFVMDGFTANPLPGRLGTHYDNGTLYFAVTWFYDSNPFNDIEEAPTGGYKYDNPDFGVRDSQSQILLNVGGVFRSGNTPCTNIVPNPDQNRIQPMPPGCTGGHDRRVIIWFADDETQGHPDIQVVYYHVDVTTVAQYPNRRSICSQTDRSETWLNTMNNAPGYAVCRVTSGSYVGDARWIGWSSATHLHYEVWVYNAATQSFPDNTHWRIDPLTAFNTFR